jgi:hypothetical protein
MKTKTWTPLVAVTMAALPLAASGAMLTNLNLSGITEYEGWEGLTAANNPGFPGFFNFTDPWPNPITPSIAGSAGNAGFDKLNGGGYAGSQSIYNFTAPGTFAVANASPLADLETVALQLDLGEGDSFLLGSPVLNYNGGSQALSPTFTQSGNGPTAFTNPQTGDPSTTTLFGFQWDLSSVGSITDYSIQWTTDAHVTTYNLQLDSSDSFTGNSISAVPEPATYPLAAAFAALAFVATRRRLSRS